MHVIGTTAIALVMASALATFAVPAHAQTKSVSVSYGDLDLSSAAGVATLNGRIKHAVRSICGSAPIDIASRSGYKACKSQAMQGAEPQLALAMLKAKREAYAEANTRPTSR